MLEEPHTLNTIRDQIEKMSKFNQIEILRILNKNNVTINENKNGIHVNLSKLSDTIVNELLVYIKYVNTQENYLTNIEKEKEKYIDLFNKEKV